MVRSDLDLDSPSPIRLKPNDAANARLQQDDRRRSSNERGDQLDVPSSDALTAYRGLEGGRRAERRERGEVDDSRAE